MDLSAMLYTAEGRVNTKKTRKSDTMVSSSYDSSIAPAYTSNSTKEELCLEYIKSFTEQFDARSYKEATKGLKNKRAKVTPRMSPFLVAENEFGVKKLVCTTLRPTEMPIPELYDMHEVSSFLAGYINYEPLDPPTRPPTTIFSPTRTLDTHTGDSFDLSTLLCSFLIGSGYDAYVVCGYAPRFITLRDQSDTECPISTVNEGGLGNTAKLKQQLDDLNSSTGEKKGNGTYTALDNTVKRSKYLAEQAELERIQGLDKFKLWLQDEDHRIGLAQTVEKELEAGSKRFHSWVLVCAGKKEVKENVFIEPSTGRVYAWNNSPYLGIESLWNNLNYWVNMQKAKKISELDFDLKSDPLWEQLFLSGSKKSSGTEGGGERGDDDADGDLMEQDNGEAGPESKDDPESRYFDAPPSWVEPLSITRKNYLLKHPPMGKRTVQYYCAKADFFAKKVNSQSMVMRVTLYLDKSCTTVKEVHEWFESRKDKMYKRVRYVLENRRFVEYYHPGGMGEMKKKTEYPGRSVETDFHVDGRLDRMCRREEIIGERVVEYFKGRTDLMSYRSIEITTDSALAGSRQFILPGGTLAPELYILRMVQKFAKDSNVTNGTDIAQRAFYVSEGKAVFSYHFAASQITGAIKTYLHTRGPLIPVISDFALSQEVGFDDDPDALQEAATIERECYSLIKGSFQQHERMQDNRRESEKVIVVEKNVFEKAMDAMDKNASLDALNKVTEVSGGEGKGTDYLTPFFRNVHDPAKITKEEALEIRQSALDALKARLVERANIIQTRLHDENAKLARKQEQFQRSQREGDLSTEEYEKYCTEAMFRIQILEQRLAAHEETAVRKFQDLDSRLSNDPRLRIIRN